MAIVAVARVSRASVLSGAQKNEAGDARHHGDALDEVRRSEYKRLSGEDLAFIKGQRYTLLSNRENLDLDGQRALKLLLKANSRIHKAYLLKESFGQLW